MNCVYCGESIPDGTEFCSSCGRQQPDPAAAPPDEVTYDTPAEDRENAKPVRPVRSTGPALLMAASAITLMLSGAAPWVGIVAGAVLFIPLAVLVFRPGTRTLCILGLAADLLAVALGILKLKMG